MGHVPGPHYAGRLASIWLLFSFHPWLCPQGPVFPQVLLQRLCSRLLVVVGLKAVAEVAEVERINWREEVEAHRAHGGGGCPTTVSASAAAAANPPNLPPQTYRYRLAPGDRLVTSVFKIEGYEAEVQVLSDGTINLPRLGTVVVWGLTLEEARQRITAGYREFLRRPLVYLDLVEQRPVRVTVTGQVLRPVFSPCRSTVKGSIGGSAMIHRRWC